MAKREDKEDEEEMSLDYRAAVDYERRIGEKLLETAKNSHEGQIKMRCLDGAIGAYRRAQKALDFYQSEARSGRIPSYDYGKINAERKFLSNRIESITDVKSRLKRMSGNGKGKTIENYLGRTFAVLSFASFILAIVFISSSLTGFVIGSRVQTSSAFSLIFFVMGLGFMTLYFESRGYKKKNSFRKF